MKPEQTITLMTKDQEQHSVLCRPQANISANQQWQTLRSCWRNGEEERLGVSIPGSLPPSPAWVPWGSNILQKGDSGPAESGTQHYNRWWPPGMGPPISTLHVATQSLKARSVESKMFSKKWRPGHPLSYFKNGWGEIKIYFSFILRVHVHYMFLQTQMQT